MAAAYAALLSAKQIIDQIKNHHCPPISLDKQQVESLTANVAFLQEFLEGYNHAGYSKEADALEMRIADVAHAVEDVIESHIVNQILSDGCTTHGEATNSIEFYEALQKMIDDIDIVKKEVMDMRDKMGGDVDHLHEDSSTSVGSSSTWQNRSMVGFDDVFLEVLDKLTGQQSSRQIISIAGMGGIGKTTLARNVYDNQRIVECFDFHAWITISQKYEIRKILLKLLEGERENLSQLEENELGYKLYQKLFGKKYFIIMDDIWNIEVWEQLKMFFPDNNNGSRVMITTRLLNVARQIDNSYNIFEMEFLDEDNSWKLFCKHVFGKEDCPIELKGIGKKIVEGCKGLPLSIIVVGGVLAKSTRTQQHWENIAENLSSIVNLEDNEHCLQILYMSYNSLPAHLKPCFLYMGGFDNETPMLFVIQLWVAEGFVKPIYGKSLEEAAKEYVIELIDRNLLLISKVGQPVYWMFHRCIIHDLLRDLCLRESEKQNFLSVPRAQNLNTPHSIGTIRRIAIVESTPEEEVLPILESASLLRSLRCHRPSLSSTNFPLLRVSLVDGINDLEDIFRQVNLRFMFLEVSNQHGLSSSISRFWNVQTLIVQIQSYKVLMAPFEIWMMPQLRCFMGNQLYLPDPPSAETDNPDGRIIMENLHTLGTIHNLKCSEEVVKRIRHIKTLLTCYTEVEGSSLADYYLDNLGGLQELEQLTIEVLFMQSPTVQNVPITFPCSLKALILFGTSLHWDDVTTKIGSLPLLEYLRLDRYSCIGTEWETVEGHFCSLKKLLIFGCSDLEYWVTENTHFPHLECLVLHDFDKLSEIPSSIGNILMLQSIEVKKCCDSVNISAERIKEEQEEFGNEDLQVQVIRSRRVEDKDTLEEATEVQD